MKHILDVVQAHPRYKVLFRKPNPEGYICFQDGFIAGYSEAKKEQEEFKENVRQMLIHFNKSSLTLGTVTLEENIVKFCSYKHDVLRYLKDNEQ